MILYINTVLNTALDHMIIPQIDNITVMYGPGHSKNEWEH